MRVIPVLDLMAGRAVRAEGGRREGYAPVHSVLLPEERAGDALALAGAFRDRLGRDEWYVADLDAITGGAPQQALLDALAVAGGRLLVDAAVTTPRRAHRASRCAARRNAARARAGRHRCGRGRDPRDRSRPRRHGSRPRSPAPGSAPRGASRGRAARGGWRPLSARSCGPRGRRV